MEETAPVCLDENSNKDIARLQPTGHKETLLNPEKSTMRQRRSLERERKYSGVIQASNGEMVDLTTADIDVSSISPSDHALNEKLLSESRKVSEKFDNRRGRRFSPAKKGDDVVSDDTSPDSSPEPLKDDMSPSLITQEERVGAEGDSDPEEEKAKSRKDSDDFDVKADLMKAIGPIKTDSTPKSALSSSKIRQEKKTKRPVFKLHAPMPELSEEGSEDTCLLPNGTLESLETVTESTDTCKVEVPLECSIKEEGEVKWEGGEGEPKQRKSSILSETLLKALGLKKGEGDKKAVLTEQEVEDKYNSLTFAFKTDRLTLEQRYKLQQHQRNVIEKNLQDELRDHAGVVQSLERRCAEDEIARTDINKLKQHIDVIQYALVKLASKAEGFGAVQQEDRLSRASDIMVTYVENIKRSLEKERSELTEAKRVLHENKILLRGTSFASDDTDSVSRLRRSSTLTSPAMKQSLHGIVRQKLMRKTPSISDIINESDESKRRASVAAVLGFGTSAGASDGRNRFASLANAALVDRSLTSPLAGRGSLETCKEGESEKQDSPRFSEVNKKKLSISLSGGSHSPELPQLSPIKPLTPPASSPTLKSPLLSSTPVVIREDGDRKNNSERSKTEEEIYQQGFEQGVRSQISQELDDLRDQQRVLCENLEEIMEAAEDEEEDDNEKNSETQPMLKWVRQYSKTIPWSRASRIGRLVLTGTLFILAIISIIGTILPLERCSGGATLFSAPWEEVVRVLGPYTNIYHPRPPPI
ncbi:inositol 1,4,5-triphosphate receptor associated 1-like isoform X3 [Lytechinus pictus]|uniref:inositol 1,4,5-triphosphate receptor associated 1-like isoform X3 n=1 Tax=Lytechinus pictus TaxID=7653 RepID=UPI0030B9ADE0